LHAAIVLSASTRFGQARQALCSENVKNLAALQQKVLAPGPDASILAPMLHCSKKFSSSLQP
jgi:hypothetical protein